MGIEDVAPTAAVSDLKAKLLNAGYGKCDDYISQVGGDLQSRFLAVRVVS